jgi:hypothetical protein
MARILIANIGNRNLTQDGIYLNSDRDFNDGLNFRERTERLAQQLPTLPPNLSLAILDVLLAHPDLKADRVLLIGSDQHGDTRKDQDTYFAALLAGALISQNFGLPVEVLKSQAHVTEEDGQLRTYAALLRGKYAEADTLLFCEAGGTATQKFALRLYLEFNALGCELETWYVKQTDLQHSTAERVTGKRFRKLLQAETIVALAQQGNFWGAIMVYDGNLSTPIKNDPVRNLLYLAANRYELLTYSHIGGQLRDKDKQQFPPMAFQEQWPPGKLGKHVVPDAWNRCCEQLSVAQHALAARQYTHFLRYAYAFQETFMLGFIEKNLTTEGGKPIPLFKRYDWYKAEFVKRANQFETVQAYVKGKDFKEANAGLSTQILVGQALATDEAATLIAQFYQLSDELGAEREHGWRILRNRASHEGKGLAEGDIEHSCPQLLAWFPQWVAWAGLPTPGLYAQLQTHLAHLLKQ